MKCATITTLISALALATTAAADSFKTTKSYSDSDCSILSMISTANLGDEECSVSTSECTADDDGDSYITSCASSLTSDMGDYAYYLYYSDAACAQTPNEAIGAPGYETCAITGESASLIQNCDNAGNLTLKVCSDTTCTTCETSQTSTTECAPAFLGYSKAVCGKTSEDDVCFSGDDTVSLASGATKMLSELKVGEEVLTADANGDFTYAAVVAMPHPHNTKLATFMHVSTASGKSIKATKLHLLQQCDGTLAYAGALAEGDCLRTMDGDEAVTSVSVTKAEGIYTAVTTNEFLVVNGIVASPFAVTHGLVNAYYQLHRTVAAYFPSALKSTFLLAANALLGGAFLTSGK